MKLDHVIKAFTATRNNKEYLMAECNYGHLGVDDAIYAVRDIGTTEWLDVKTVADVPSPCATFYFLDGHAQNAKDFPLDEFKEIVSNFSVECKIKRFLFDSNYKYTEAGEVLEKHVNTFLNDIFKAFVAKGYSPREVSHLISLVTIENELNMVLEKK